MTTSTIVADDNWAFWVVRVNVDRGMGRRVAGAVRDDVLRNDLGLYIIVASEAPGRNGLQAAVCEEVQPFAHCFLHVWGELVGEQSALHHVQVLARKVHGVRVALVQETLGVAVLDQQSDGCALLELVVDHSAKF